MLRLCYKVTNRISTKFIDNNSRYIKRSSKINFYPVVGLREQRLGACIINQPNNQNILNQHTLDQLFRHLSSYNHDHSVENIWIESKNKIFSHGADYKEMAESQHYLDKLFNFAIMVARLNKPIFAQIAGGVKGIASYILTLFSAPLSRPYSYLKIDDLSRGMIPLIGGTHRLSKIPLHFGFYLALAGQQITSEEMGRLEFTKGTISDTATNLDIRKKLCEANLYFRERLRLNASDSATLLEPQQKFQLMQVEQNKYNETAKHQAHLINMNAKNINMKFALNQYNLSRIDYENTTHPYNDFSQKEQHSINNYFELRRQRPLAYLQKHQLINQNDFDNLSVPRFDLAKINSIFGLQSLHQIMEELSKDKSDWGIKTYNQIKSKNPLVLHLTFQLLKSAKKKPWIQCLEAEYTVARRLINNSKLEMAIYSKSSQYVFKNAFSGKQYNQIDPSVISDYLSPPKFYEQKLQHELPSSYLAPNIDYKQIPDNPRTFLNDQCYDDPHLVYRHVEVMKYLNLNKINYRSKAFDLNILRKNIFERFLTAQTKHRYIKELQYYATHEGQLQRYLNSRKKYLNDITDDQISKMTKDKIQKYFADQLNNRFTPLKDQTFKIASMQRKLRLFKYLKNILTDNILYNGGKYEKKRKNDNNYTGPIYFDSENKDIFHSVNPNLSYQQPLHKLAQELAVSQTVSDQYLEGPGKEIKEKFIGMNNTLSQREQKEKQMCERILYRYAERPQVWLQAYTYKELVLQASKTSTEIEGYLDWEAQNYYDLILNNPNPGDTYGDFAIDVVNQIKNIRQSQKKKLINVEAKHKILKKSGLFTEYQLQSEKTMRSFFPFFFNQRSIPKQFRKSFLAIVDSTLQKLLPKNIQSNQLIFTQQFGQIDRWINHNIADNYTNKLQADVEYISSYLGILFVKQILLILNQNKENDKKSLIQKLRNQFGVEIQDKLAHQEKITLIYEKFKKFLYFLMDMHASSKKNLKFPQAKLLDFINRIKLSSQHNQYSVCPYSFEGLMLLIAKDRRKIYDRFLKQTFISQPQYLETLIYRLSKDQKKDFVNEPSATDQEQEMKEIKYINQNSVPLQKQLKSLPQNYFYYMMTFQKYVQKMCGPQSFIPQNYKFENDDGYLKFAQNLLRPQQLEKWFSNIFEEVIQKILAERFEIQKGLTKGELILFDKKFEEKFLPNNIRMAIQKHLQEQIAIVKNMFTPNPQYQNILNQSQKTGQSYVAAKRIIKNEGALKKLNNLVLAEKVFDKYMIDYNPLKAKASDRALVANQMSYFVKNGLANRLPLRTYQRIARELYDYPQDNASVINKQTQSKLKDNISFNQSYRTEKITVTDFTQQYKQLNSIVKNNYLKQMLGKIKLIESL